MKFDVIIGNPPYQQNLGNEAGNKSKSKAIYHHFISQAINLKPKYISMIVPSRWMTKSAEGISDKWVENFLKSNKIQELHDFLNSEDCFKNVNIEGGVNYFLWNINHNCKCNYYIHSEINNISHTYDYLDPINIGVVLRDKYSRDILKKISLIDGEYFNDINNNFSGLVSPKDFFTTKHKLTSSWNDFSIKPNNIYNTKYYLNKKVYKDGVAFIKKEDICKNIKSIDVNKVYIPAANGGQKNILGKPFKGDKNSVCSQTYLVIGYDKIKHDFTENECENIISYIKTKFFRYLVSLKKKTQNGPRGVYQLVPIQNFKKNWTDEELYKKYNFSENEINYIENKISKMD